MGNKFCPYCLFLSLFMQLAELFPMVPPFFDRPFSYGDIEENPNFGGDSSVPL